MGRKKAHTEENNPIKDKLPAEDLSTTEELDADSDTMEEATVTETKEVDATLEEANEAEEVNEANEAEVNEANETIDNNEITATTETPKEKRGRGRPKKSLTKGEVDGSTGKKKRGRPRKSDGFTNGTEKSPKKSVPRVYLDFDDEDYSQKRRGRPKKPQVVLTTDDNPSEYLEWYEDETGVEQNVEKKKRGRPKKFDEIDYLEWYNEDQSETVAKKKRGRPKKFDSPELPKKAKKPRKTLPKILLKGYDGDFNPQKRRGRPRKSNTAGSSKNEARLGSEVDRLGCLVDRLENRINLDGLIDEDTDIESEQEIDKQIFLLQRNFNVKLDIKNDFKVIVKSYLEDLGAVQGCLIATVRSYKNSGRIVVFEIWESEAEQSDFSKDSTSRIFDKETSEMLKNNSVVKNMNIPARWWQRTR